MIPKNLRYQNKKPSAYARNYTTHIQPQNGTGDYGGGETIIINIPTNQNIVMSGSESVLKFDLTVTNGAAANAYVRLDRAGAHGCIQRLRLYHGSQLIEDIDNYGELVADMMSLQQSGDAAKGKMNVMAGLSSEYITDSTTKQTFPVFSGERLMDSAQSTPFADIQANLGTKVRTYTINLMSIVGSLSDKYIPLFAMTSAPLRLELQLVSEPAKFICSELDLASFKVNNCEFIGNFMELGSEAMNIISKSIPNGRLEWVVPSWRNYVHNASLANATTQVSIPVPAKFNSLKSLILSQRQFADGALKQFPLGSYHYNLNSYSLRLGSRVVPSKKPEKLQEFFVEALKAVASVSDVNHEPNISLSNYNNAVPDTTNGNTETEALITTTASSPSFVVGMDLETYSNADKDSIYSGYNSSNDDIFWNMTFNANSTTPIVRFDTYALFDNVLVCEAGVCYSNF